MTTAMFIGKWLNAIVTVVHKKLLHLLLCIKFPFLLKETRNDLLFDSCFSWTYVFFSPITLHQMEIIWDELGSKFKNLLEMGRSGVVASIVAACQRLHSNENKVSSANHDPLK